MNKFEKWLKEKKNFDIVEFQQQSQIQPQQQTQQQQVQPQQQQFGPQNINTRVRKIRQDRMEYGPQAFQGLQSLYDSLKRLAEENPQMFIILSRRINNVLVKMGVEGADMTRVRRAAGKAKTIQREKDEI